MHWNFEQILWALVLAGHLVLLVVLLGRDRVSRFPWFTASIALSAVRLIADHLLHSKLTSLAFYWQSYSSMLLGAIIAIFVLIELTRQVFSSGKAGLILKPRGWAGWTLITFAIAAATVWAWGPWPSWQAIHSQPNEVAILLLLLTALKGQLFAALLTVEVALLLLIFGRRFGFGWKSHPQMIAIGLSTNAIGFLALQATTELMQRNVHVHSAEERQQVALRLNHLFINLDNARFALWFLVLIWWIVWLWRDASSETTQPSADLVMLDEQAQLPELVSGEESSGDAELNA